MKRVRALRLTAGFEANLAEIEAFLSELGNGIGFDALLAELETELIPNLEHFPRLGRSFLDRVPASAEGYLKLESLRRRVQGRDLREYLQDDYLILYLDDGKTIHLLSIRHHRKLSYNLTSHWS
jgi:ParE toxin of type II toxin-antitoxin system, parDE